MPVDFQAYPSASFFSQLPNSLRNVLINNSKKSRYEDGDLIYPRGDKAQAISIIASGSARFSNLGRDGKRIATITLGAGESFGELTVFTDMPRLFDIHANGAVIINTIKRSRFEKLLETEPELSKFIIRLMARRFLMVLEVLDDERRLPLVVRLAKTLLRRPRTSETDLDITVTQKELADELTVSRVALGTAIKKLKQLDLIETAYGHVKIVDLVAFQAWVEQQSQLVALVADS